MKRERDLDDPLQGGGTIGTSGEGGTQKRFEKIKKMKGEGFGVSRSPTRRNKEDEEWK